MVDLKLDKYCKLAEPDSPDKYTNILTPTKSYYAAYQEYIDILADLGQAQKSFCFKGRQINIQSFHYIVATPLVALLIKEIKESFNVYPVLIKEYERISCSCALHNFHPSITPTAGDLPFYYDVENAKKIYLF